MGIRSRVENLDKQIERRRSARDEIISLQLEVLTNEADGLGFFSTSAPVSVRFYQPMPSLRSSGARLELEGSDGFGVSRPRTGR